MWTRMGRAPAGEAPSDADVTALCGEADADPSTSSARTFSRGGSPPDSSPHRAPACHHHDGDGEQWSIARPGRSRGGGDDNTDPGEIHDDLEGAPGDGRAGIDPEQCGVKNRCLNDAAGTGAQTPAICVPPKVKTSPTVRMKRMKMIGNPRGRIRRLRRML